MLPIWAILVWAIPYAFCLLFAVLCTLAKWPQDWTKPQKYDSNKVPQYIFFWGMNCGFHGVILGIYFLICVCVVLFRGEVGWYGSWVINYALEVFTLIVWFSCTMAYNPPDEQNFKQKLGIMLYKKLS